jgi:hypothetical protein
VIHYGTPRLRYLSHNEIMKDRNIHPDLRLQSAVIALTESRRPIEQLHANAVIGELWNDQVKIQYDPQIKGAFDKNINEAKSELRAPEVRVQFARAAMNCAITPKERHAAVDAVSENSGKLGPYYLALAYLTTERDSEGKNWFNDLCFKEQINPMQFESSTYIHEIAIHPRSIESIVPPYDQAIQSQRPGWKDSSAQIPQTLRPGNRPGASAPPGAPTGPKSLTNAPTGPDPRRIQPGQGGYGGVQMPLRQQPQRPRPANLVFGFAEQPPSQDSGRGRR